MTSLQRKFCQLTLEQENDEKYNCSKPVDPSSSPLTAPITSRPEFLVPMSLLVVLIVAGLMAGVLYLRHQKR